MSDYTTQVRYICESYAGLNESVGYDKVNEVIAGSWQKIFDSDIPIFDENYRAPLFTKILRHYYDREIGFETTGLWKLKLNNKLHEIMPYYNKLYKSELLEYNPLEDVNVKKEYEKTVNSKSNTEGENTSNMSSDSSIDVTSERKDNIEHLDIYSDTPQGYIENVDINGYMTEARKINDINNSNGTDKTVSKDTNETKGTLKTSINVDNIDTYVESLVGRTGHTGSELLTQYRETLLNIDRLIINELKDLFMCIW